MTEEQKIEEQESGNDARSLFNVASIFAKALGFILEDNQGIVIEMENHLYNPMGESPRIAVIKHEGVIRLENLEEEHPDGTCLEFEMDPIESEDEISNENPPIYPESQKNPE